jgi:hypothetical protein
MADKKFSVLIGCYGQYPQYSVRCLDSVLMQQNVEQLCDVHVGCGACCEQTLDTAWAYYKDQMLTSLLVTHTNINKDPMMRLLIERTQTPYFLWFDDDTHIGPDFLKQIDRFIEKEHPFDGAGQIFFMGRQPQYMEFARKRPWWNEQLPRKDRIHFPTGGLFLGRTAFCLQHDFPDRQMVKRSDDILFGDLLAQHGKMVGWSKTITRNHTISDGKRRGEGEGPAAFGIFNIPDIQTPKP